MPRLYVVATPIGNLEDITLRALRVLREVGLIAAEDTRTTRRLLSAYDIHTPVTSFHQHNQARKTPLILRRLARTDVALVSEAGTPCINDPGHRLVQEARARGFPVVPVPGPSVVAAALSVAGLPAQRFLYLGFLPRRKGERRALLASSATERGTLVALETPHRLREALQDILEVLGDRPLTVCRELTKAFEEVYTGTVRGALERFRQPLGEFTLVIAGAGGGEAGRWDEAEVRSALARMASEGVPPREAVSAVAGASGWPRRQVYRVWLEVRAGGRPSP